MKSKTTACVLALLLGGFGAHKFYLGRPGQGILYLLFCWTLIPGIIACFEFFIYAFGSEEKFNNKYNGGGKKCKFCSEYVKVEAVKCKHCSSKLK